MEKPTLLQKYDISSDEEGNNYIGGVKNEEKIKSKWTEKEDVLIENEFTIKPRQIKLLTKKQKREENENLTKINKEKDNEKSKMKIFQYIEPNNSSLSPVIIWSLTPSKDGKLQGQMILNARSFYLIGKDSESHIKVNHYSCSRYHCVIQFLKKDNEVIPYILDLKSTNGTFINENKIESGKYIKLNNFDVINLGQSKTDFIIANSNYK